MVYNNLLITGFLNEDPTQQYSAFQKIIAPLSPTIRQFDGKKMDQITINVSIHSWQDAKDLEDAIRLLRGCFPYNAPAKPERPALKHRLAHVGRAIFMGFLDKEWPSQVTSRLTVTAKPMSVNWLGDQTFKHVQLDTILSARDQIDSLIGFLERLKQNIPEDIITSDEILPTN